MNPWLRLTQLEATAAPVALDLARKHLRVYHTDEDTCIQTLVDAAVAFIEGPNGIGLALSPQKWRLSLDSFYTRYGGVGYGNGYGYSYIGGLNGAIAIPLGPVTSVESISYADDTGATHTLPPTSYVVDVETSPSRVTPPYGGMWPITIAFPGAVKIDFTAGFAKAPADIVAAILLLVGHWFENREAVKAGERAAAIEVPFTVDAILDKYRVGRFA